MTEEYDIELRETRLRQVAPIGNNLVRAFVAQHVLGPPRSYQGDAVHERYAH